MFERNPRPINTESNGESEEDEDDELEDEDEVRDILES